MTIYLFLFTFLTVAYIPLSKTKQKKSIYCFTVCIVLTLIVGMRSISMGLVDTELVYYPRFIEISRNDIDYVFTQKDQGYQLFTYYFIKIFGADFRLYCIVSAFPYVLGISFLINKYSTNPCLSYIVFVCMHYFEISFTLMRQVFGMGILCFALYCFINKRYKTFIFLVILSSFFHQVCIAFLVLLVFVFLKPKKWMLLPLLAIIVLCMLYPQQLLGSLYTLIEDQRFTRYEMQDRTKNLTFFFINLVMWIAETLFYRINPKSREYDIMYICSCICLAISPLTLALGEMSRVAYLFGFVHVVMLPSSVLLIKKDNRSSQRIVKIAFASVFILYFLIFLGPQVNIIPYESSVSMPSLF